MALLGEDQNISFWCEKARALRWEKRREEEKIQVWKISFSLELWNSCLEISYSCLELWFETFVLICWLGNYLNSFFVYVWVRKTLTLQYMCILVGLSQFWGWFSFGWKISDENGKN